MLRRLFRTSGVRLAVFGACLALVSAAVVFAVIYTGTLGTMRRTLDTDISNEIAEILTAGPATPPAAVREGVRTALAERHANVFFLLDSADGDRLAGNLDIAMPGPGWHTLIARDDERFAKHVHALRGRVVDLSGGGRLFVAADATMLDELDELIRRSFLIGFGITLGIGLVAGIGFGWRALARVKAVSEAGREIMEGDFTRRIPLSGSGDEFDHLAAIINAMLERIELLMANIRAVGDEIAHDLRSPLARLRESLELALRLDEPEAMRAAMMDAIGQVDAALGLSAAILRLARIESGSRRAFFARLDLSRLLESIAETYQTVAEDAGGALSAMIEPGLAMTGDAALLNQMAANLIENAITHGGAGGSAGTAITLGAVRAGRDIVMTVADDGPGIPEERHALALRRFGRLDASRATEGHGLGLPLAAAIATLHDASFTLTKARNDPARPGLKITLRFARALER